MSSSRFIDEAYLTFLLTEQSATEDLSFDVKSDGDNVDGIDDEDNVAQLILLQLFILCWMSLTMKKKYWS